MTDSTSADWSPADNPYAIAVSEAQWWQRATQLAVQRLGDPDDQRISWFSSRQIDARQLVFALRQLLNAEQLEQVALKALGIDPIAGNALAQARQKFEDALPGIKHMRDALMHFDEWSRGEGHGPQKDRVKAGEALRDVAREYWGFAYDPSAGTVSLGPYTIHVDIADQAAAELSHAIYMAAREVDKKNTTELRVRTVTSLTDAGILCNSPEDTPLKVSPGGDGRIWLSLDVTADSDEDGRRELAEQIVSALATAGLRLVSLVQTAGSGPIERFARGETLYAEPNT
ncbi:hypothetical protein [Frankia sp. Cppng1_Ct_nod]|uniref:hypothetical protein n=1 Tax=Frankia sp. Cppng1_Ct_nod TaxID=2897162 RepID=UPI0010418AF3|nr:hypothetical protein [Frankia sp. Cppng1_Ct_nod]